MAKPKTIDDVLKDLSKNYQSILLKAMKETTDIACKDIYQFSMSCIDRYYANYDPTSYQRTDNLWKMVVPIAKVEQINNKIISTVGVEYDANLLDGYYYSNSKKNNDIYPENQWIIENYLMGIHPTTNGSSNPDFVEYIPIQDVHSPHEYMERYLTMYRRKFDKKIDNYLLSYITK